MKLDKRVFDQEEQNNKIKAKYAYSLGIYNSKGA